jgi:glycosyltransferase involved in cell wall biosynthesis
MSRDSLASDTPTPIAVHHFGPDTPNGGGIERVVSILVEHRVGADETTFHPVRARGNAKVFLAAIVGIARSLRRIPKHAVVHAHLSQDGSFLREGWVLTVARARGVTTVATIHGSRFVVFARDHPKLVSFVLNKADAVICLSEDALTTVRSLAPRTTAVIVPNPVPADPTSLPADTTSEHVLFAGELSERKGVDVLCRAWPIVASRRPRARCTLVGPPTGLSVPTLERMSVKPAVPPGEIGALIRDARVVVLPSRNEGMPMILTEALGAGRPFVSTPVGGIAQLSNGTQPLVAVGDHLALADRLTELLEDSELATRLGEAGRDFHAQTRNTDVIGRTLRGIYTTALDHRRGIRDTDRQCAALR